MKRLGIAVFLAIMLTAAAFGDNSPRSGSGSTTVRIRGTRSVISDSDVIGRLKLSELELGTRVRLHFVKGQPFVGTVVRVTDDKVYLDLTSEVAGLSGKMGFRKKRIHVIEEIKPQSEADKKKIISNRTAVVAQLRIEAVRDFEDRRAKKREEEEGELADAEAYRKSLDVVVGKKQEERMRSLLQTFPSDQWDEARYRKINENWVLRDLKPTNKERQFMAVFEEWRDARDAIAVLDEQKKEKTAGKLVLRFPPSRGWGEKRLEEILAKEIKGTRLTDKEADFKDNYEAWVTALLRRVEELEAGESQAEEEPAEKPVEKVAEPVETNEQPAEKKEEPPAEQDKKVEPDGADPAA